MKQNILFALLLAGVLLAGFLSAELISMVAGDSYSEARSGLPLRQRNGLRSNEGYPALRQPHRLIKAALCLHGYGCGYEQLQQGFRYRGKLRK